jgi:hemerythrin
MALSIWNDSYSVHNDKIDCQHKVLFDIFARLHTECNNNDMELLHVLLRELHDYTIDHFKSEEEYMVEMRYKGVIMHRIEHRYFEKRIREVMEQESDRSADRLRILITFLSSWLVQHVVGEDKKIPVTAAVGNER